MPSTASTAVAAPWKALLQRSIINNSSLPYAKYVQVATVRLDGRPANRTVVFRGFLGDSNDLTFVTDKRSRKVAEVQLNPHAEICWYFPTTREQYRISGSLSIIGPEEHHTKQLLEARHTTWSNMSNAGRSQFMWPEPRQPRMTADESLFLQPNKDDAGEPSGNFCLVVMKVDEVDLVDLYANRRTIFTGSSGATEGTGPATWQSEEVNP